MKTNAEKIFLSGDYSLKGSYFRFEPLTDHVKISFCRYRIKEDRHEDMKLLVKCLVEQNDDVTHRVTDMSFEDDSKFMLVMT